MTAHGRPMKKTPIPRRNSRKEVMQNARDREATAKAARQQIIVIDDIPPSYNKWNTMHYHEQTRMKQDRYYLVQKAVHESGIRKIETPCVLSATVFKRSPRAGDSFNMGTTIDKLYIDALTEPGRGKARGLGLLPDDNYNHVPTCCFTLRKCGKGERERTELVFEPVRGRGAHIAINSKKFPIEPRNPK